MAQVAAEVFFDALEVIVTAQFEEVIHVFQGDAEAFGGCHEGVGKIAWSSLFQGSLEAVLVTEDPGVADRAATEQDTVDACFRDASSRLFQRADVAVAEDECATSLGHLNGAGDGPPVGLAAVHLL